LRVVFDTNILISALIAPGGPPEDVCRLVLEGRVELVTSRPLLAEPGRVLTEKLGWERSRADEAVAQVARLAHVVRRTETVSEIAADPSDDRVLEAAAEGGAEVIVSGDRHLLRLGTWRSVPVEPATKFLMQFQ
jgi:putative PIN family toxin of toxin-antitoxin system